MSNPSDKQPAPPPDREPPSVTSQVRVLLVDDDRAGATQRAVALRGAGYDAQTAASAEEAMVAIGASRPHVIVFELVLPAMSGLLFAQRLKAASATRGIVLVAMSAVDGPDPERLARAAGCSGFVHKPVVPGALPALIASCLAGGQ